MQSLLKKLKTTAQAAILPIKKLTVSQWANEFLKLPSTAAEPGQYKTSRTPYVTEIMDAFTQENIHKIVFKSAAQTGKSQLMLAIVGRYAHLDPASIMIVQPTLETATDFSRDRIERMIQDTPILTPLFKDFGKSRSGSQTVLSKMYRGGRIVLVGANSPAGLASKPIRILLCDEVDRFGDSAGDEGDAISLAEKRQTSYWNYKTGIFSTPTVEGVSRIDKEYLLGTQEKWLHQCPNCGEFHFLDYRQMVTDYEEKIDEFNNRTVTVNSVTWKCPDCAFQFSELTMKNSAQKYVAENPAALKNGVRSFWVNGFSSTFLSWKTIMREYLEAQGAPLRESVVFNTRFGVSYALKGEYNDENIFLQRREEILAELPDEVKILTAGVDVQANRLEVSVFGYGLGEQIFGICHSVINGSPNEAGVWLALDNFLDRQWHFSNGTALKIARTFVDSGYSTKIVYEYCRARLDKGVFAIKGNGAVGIPLLYKFTTIRNYGIVLTILGVNDGKNQVFSCLAVNQPSPHYVHFFKDNENFRRGFDSQYFKQLISEHRVARKFGGIVQLVWEKIGEKERNEALDCFIYSLAAFKSCVGNLNVDDFFKQLEKPVATKKSPAVQSRSIDIY